MMDARQLGVVMRLMVEGGKSAEIAREAAGGPVGFNTVLRCTYDRVATASGR